MPDKFNAVLEKAGCVFYILLYTLEGKAMIGLKFVKWLDARIALDDLGDSVSIVSIKDTTHEAVNHGYRNRDGVDV